MDVEQKGGWVSRFGEGLGGGDGLDCLDGSV